MLSLPHSTFLSPWEAERGEGEGAGLPSPLPLPVEERKGDGRKVRAVRRSTDASTVATLFQRVVETYALSANVPLTIMALSWLRLINSPGF